MKILTWNINSIRLRYPIVLRVIEELNPDILCLQETKCPDEAFPHKHFKKAGYNHIHIHGMKGYNGQAIISRIPFDNVGIHHRVGREDCRHIAVTVKHPQLADPVELHNLYIPAGGDEPDPEINLKYRHKLDFVDEMTYEFSNGFDPRKPLIAVGDFNIAPLEHDVWSHKQLLKVVSHTEPEITRIKKMQQSLDFTDVSRHFIPENEKCYTWWSYRNRDWRKSNRGRRLDHIWVTDPLKPLLKSHHIHAVARDWNKPSDHVPLMVELDA